MSNFIDFVRENWKSFLAFAIVFDLALAFTIYGVCCQ